jgi:nucleoside-diphosphate-sugar epimerase
MRAEQPLTGVPQVAVLGGTGFLGRELLEQWPASGPRPRFLVHRSKPDWLDSSSAQVVAVDLDDDSSLASALDGALVLVSLLRPDGTGWCRESMTRAMRVAREAGVVRCVHASSIDVYAGVREPLVDEETAARPDSDYGREHRDLELLVRDAFDDAVVVRLGAVFGPGGLNLAGLVREAAARRRRRLALRRFLYGRRRMHLVSVQYAAQALVQLASTTSDPVGLVLVTQDDQPDNNFASVYDNVVDRAGLQPLPGVPSAPAWVLRAVLRMRKSSPYAATRRFSSQRAQAWGLVPAIDFQASVADYVDFLIQERASKARPV